MNQMLFITLGFAIGFAVVSTVRQGIQFRRFRRETEQYHNWLVKALRDLDIDVNPKCVHCGLLFTPFGSCNEHPLGCKYIMDKWIYKHPDCTITHPE